MGTADIAGKALNRGERKSEEKFSPREVLLWLVIVGLFAAGLGANYYYIDTALPLRIAGWILLFCVVALLAVQTSKGKAVLAFGKESRAEMRKVTWPNRKETLQTTAMVAVMVVMMSALLWSVDSLLMIFVGWVTGQRG